MALPRLFAAVALCLAVTAASAQSNEVQDINLQFRKGDLAGALARANTFLAKNPKDAQVRFLKGLILADQGKTNDAIALFTGLTEDFPELPEPYNNLAVLHASQGQYDNAKIALEQAIRTHPSYATAHENLGDIYAKMASIAYDKALALDSRNTAAKTKLALIQDITGAPTRKPTPPVRPGASPSSAPATAAAVRPTPAQQPAPAGSVEAAVAAWAGAWARRDVAAYLAAYAADYAAPGLSRSAWETQRRTRIEAPSSISVEITGLKVETAGDSATATFQQAYRSDRLSSTVNKTLRFAQIGDQWRIVEETTR